jgi:hypothetical protein
MFHLKTPTTVEHFRLLHHLWLSRLPITRLYDIQVKQQLCRAAMAFVCFAFAVVASLTFIASTIGKPQGKSPSNVRKTLTVSPSNDPIHIYSQFFILLLFPQTWGKTAVPASFTPSSNSF